MSNRKYQYQYKVVKMWETQEPTTQVQSSTNAYKELKKTFSKLDDFREHMVVMGLDRANKVIGTIVLTSGGIHGTVIDVRILYKHMVEMLACGCILAHNHPSGNTNPSVNDDKITRQVLESGQMLDVLLLDHIIYTPNSFYSYADAGKL